MVYSSYLRSPTTQLLSSQNAPWSRNHLSPSPLLNSLTSRSWRIRTKENQLLSFLIFLSFLPDKCRNSKTFCLCSEEQFKFPQPLAPNVFSDSIEVLSKAKSLSYNNIHTPLMLGVWTQTVQVFCPRTERTSVWHVAAPPTPKAGITN